MDYIDYYKILGVEKTATPEQIKSAYRKMARKYHPDVNAKDPEAQKKFQQVNEANEVLSDPDKRKKYDQYGADWKHAEQYEKARQQQGSGSNPYGYNSGEDSFTYEDGGDFSDFFQSFFGGGSQRANGRQRQYRGQDYNSELHINLSDAYTTHQQILNIGSKQVRITIPAGIENGQTIRLRGYGADGVNNGPKGDLYLTFIINNNTPFNRIGDDLELTVNMDLYTAVLGGEVMVETMNGKVKLKVPPGTQNGVKTRLKGKGFPVYKKEGTFGDLYVTYQVLLPTHLTDKQKELFEELKNLSLKN
ncbi:MAG TPA: J domain-containing protein [Flavipsychrobacter sp.]|nr:J domain-containing protein [Flavipsychrobacter sp.]